MTRFCRVSIASNTQYKCWDLVLRISTERYTCGLTSGNNENSGKGSLSRMHVSNSYHIKTCVLLIYFVHLC